MLEKYILKGKTPVRMRSIIEWAEWFKTADPIVKKTQVGDVEVSTVFLSSDHQFGIGPPLLFETMIFGGERDEEMWRYSTWEEAEAGHDRVVAELSGERAKQPSNICTHCGGAWIPDRQGKCIRCGALR